MLTAARPQLWVREGETLRYLFHPGQRQTWDRAERFVLMLAGSQGGKALALDTVLPTPDGFTTMGEVQPGDKLLDEQGQPCTVTACSPVHVDHQCYRLTFDDGTTVVADAEHLWQVQSQQQRKNAARRVVSPNPASASRPQCQPAPDYSVRPTKELACPRLDPTPAYWSIDLMRPTARPDNALPIPPYTLGAWLGDGHSAGARITTADEEVLDAIRADGVLIGPAMDVNAGRASGYRIGGSAQRGGSVAKRAATLQGQLRTLGVLGRKHIPAAYLTAAPAQRLALLQGLMDTDGYVAVDGRCELSLTNPTLAADATTLIAGLGIKVRTATRENGAHRITFTTGLPVARLPRKRCRLPRRIRPDTYRRFLSHCEPVASVPVRCVAVDSPRQLYLCTRSYLPTHNTTFGPPWLYREIQRCGAGDYLAVSSSFELFKLKMLPVLREFFESLLGIGSYAAGDRILTLSDPPDTRIILRSASAGSGLESATAKAAWLDEVGQEEFDVETWEAVQRRLAISQGRVLGTTTPYLENWLKTEWYDRWEAGDPHYAVVSFASTANPTYPPEEYTRLKATMPAWRFKLFVEGRFTRPAGLIYDCFDPTVHVVEDFDLPPEWPRYVGLDFGGVNHAMVWLCRNPETNVCYVYRESMLPDMSTAERAAQAKAFRTRENVVVWSGGSGSEEQFRRDWTQAGIQVLKPLVPEVESGIDAVIKQFKTFRLLVFHSCKGLRDELGSYRRQLDDRGRPTLEIVNKRTYHRLDALRYIVPWVTTGGPNVRFL